MAAYYLDTSALVKRYIQETGTAWVQGLVSPAAANAIYVARITAVELASAVARRQRARSLSVAEAASIVGKFRQDLASGYRVMEITAKLLTAAMGVAEIHALRANDAVQLAVAVEVNARRTAKKLKRVTLVCADQELNAAAVAVGLKVEDPNLHP